MPKKKLLRKAKPVGDKLKRMLMKSHWRVADYFIKHTGKAKGEWNELLRFMRGKPGKGLHVYSIRIQEKGGKGAVFGGCTIHLSDGKGMPTFEVMHEGFTNNVPLLMSPNKFSEGAAHKTRRVYKGSEEDVRFFPMLLANGSVLRKCESNGWNVEYRMLNRGHLKGKTEAIVWMPHEEFVKLMHPLGEAFFNNAVDLKLSIAMNPSKSGKVHEEKINHRKLERVDRYPLTVHDNIFRALKTVSDTDGIALIQEEFLTGDEHKRVQAALERNMPSCFSEERSWKLIKRVGRILQARAGPRSPEREKSMRQLADYAKSNPHMREAGSLDMDPGEWLSMVNNAVEERDKRKRERYSW